MEFVIILGLIVWAVLAVRSIRKNGAGCGGDCSRCAAKCNRKNEE